MVLDFIAEHNYHEKMKTKYVKISDDTINIRAKDDLDDDDDVHGFISKRTVFSSKNKNEDDNRHYWRQMQEQMRLCHESGEFAETRLVTRDGEIRVNSVTALLLFTDLSLFDCDDVEVVIVPDSSKQELETRL